jgi:hypothetical protein
MTQPAMQRHHQSDAGSIDVPVTPLRAQPDDDLLRGLETLLFLSWDPAAPGPWFARLALFPLAGGAFFATWEHDGRPAQLVARLQPGRRPGAAPLLWSFFLSDFFADAGAYRADPLDAASPPQTITNYRPDLLPRDAVRAAVLPWGAPPAYFDSAYVEEK